jgi:hypothetical protein
LANVGRNEPCPCGSGKKYKRCCGAEDGVRAEAASEGPEGELRAQAHRLDERVVERLTRFARRTFGPDWYPRELERLGWAATRGLETLFAPALLYALPYRDGARPIAELARASGEVSFDADERAWLDAQASAWFSIFSVGSVDVGRGFEVRDVLSGQERYVHERSASQGVSLHDMLLLRVADWKGITVLAGMHPRPLPPRLGEAVALRVRTLSRKRTRPVPLEKLRSAQVVRDLIDAWEYEIAEAEAAPPPELCNMDGDPLLLTKDRFVVKAGARADLETILADLPHTDLDRDGKETHVHMSRAPARPTPGMEIVSIARGTLVDGKLVIETNSVERADAVRRMIEGAAGALVRHQSREHADPASEAVRASVPERGAPVEPPPELLAQVREMLEKHVHGWVDAELPALGGRTPRQAVKTAKGRKEVELLVRDMEHGQARQPAWQRIDLGWVRRELGLG